MTRIISDGAEFGDKYFWTYIANDLYVYPSATNPRSGSYCYNVTGPNNGYAYKDLPSTYGELFIRIAIRPETVRFCAKSSHR